MTQDILRRILVDYFGYDVHFVMNITDIDDKVCQVFKSCLLCLDRFSTLRRSSGAREKTISWISSVIRRQR